MIGTLDLVGLVQ